MRFRNIIGAFLLVAGSGALADPATIQLKDGSVVRGQINTLANGVYAVESESLGLIQIPQDRVDSIRYGDSERRRNQTPIDQSAASSLGALQQQLMADPQIMDLVMALRSDPQMQAVVSDPEIQRAVAAGDFGALINNPKFLELLDNARVREITERATSPR